MRYRNQRGRVTHRQPDVGGTIDSNLPAELNEGEEFSVDYSIYPVDFQQANVRIEFWFAENGSRFDKLLEENLIVPGSGGSFTATIPSSNWSTFEGQTVTLDMIQKIDVSGGDVYLLDRSGPIDIVDAAGISPLLITSSANFTDVQVTDPAQSLTLDWTLGNANQVPVQVVAQLHYGGSLVDAKNNVTIPASDSTTVSFTIVPENVGLGVGTNELCVELPADSILPA